MKMLDGILCGFRDCFSRGAAFEWFVVMVVGMMMRSDHLGVTSVIRELALDPNCYEKMLHFFRATSWSLPGLRKKWCELVCQHAPIYKVGDYAVLIGDGVKQSKEGKRMPGVKKLHQESENSSKAPYIHGHMFGGLGILIGTNVKRFCLPLSMRLHDGVQAAAEWAGSGIPSGTHVVRMIEDGFEAAKVPGRAILLLDRYFLSVPALEKLNQLNQNHSAKMALITKAKANCVAYEEPVKEEGRRGRPRKKGDMVKLAELFTTKRDSFTPCQMELYGKLEDVRYYCIDLLWGQKLYQKLRFVLVEYRGIQSILVSTDLTLTPEDIIRLYTYRFSIECCFREFKQQMGGFGYRFWSKVMPRLNRYRKKNQPHPLEQVTDQSQQACVLKTIQAMECYTLLASIAMGLIQMLSLHFSESLPADSVRYMRTPSDSVLSEASMIVYFRRYFFRFMADAPPLTITRFIRKKQLPLDFEGPPLAS